MSNQYSDETKEARREYHREWRRKNPERVAQIQERFWHKKAAEIRGRASVDDSEHTSINDPNR